jgi:flavin-binding protein dodecin
MSVYRVTEVIGTSPDSWEDAARQAVAAASRSLRDLRVAEVVEQDLTIAADGTIESYRTKLRLSFKYEVPVGAPEWEGQSARQPEPA